MSLTKGSYKDNEAIYEVYASLLSRAPPGVYSTETVRSGDCT